MVLDDKVVVITGGAQGLGLATALRLAPKRPHIALIDMSPHQLAEAKDATESAGATVSVWECDVSDEKAVDEVFLKLLSKMVALMLLSTTPVLPGMHCS